MSKICGTCRYHCYEPINRGYVCTNVDSDMVADWTEDDYSCNHWEEIEFSAWINGLAEKTGLSVDFLYVIYQEKVGAFRDIDEARVRTEDFAELYINGIKRSSADGRNCK